MQFLSEHQCNFDTFHGKLYADNIHVLLHKHEEQKPCRIRLKNTVVLRPYQDKIVMGFMDPKCRFIQGGVIETVSSFAKQTGLGISATLVRPGQS